MEDSQDVEQSRNGLTQRALESEHETLLSKQSANALSPPNRLPVEVLSHIFVVYASKVMQRFPSSHPQSFSWINVAHVCQHWREVAMSCTALWSNLLFVTPELTEFMLTQSKNAPLSLKFQSRHIQWIDMLRRIAAQTQRLRSVKLSDVVDSTVISSLAAEAPLLEKLVLRPYHERELRQPLEIPSDFLQWGAPLLSHLELHDVVMPHYDVLPLFPSLTHLELGSRHAMGSRKTSGKALLKALQRLPQLKALILTRYIPQDLVLSPHSHFTPIDCPALRKVKIGDPISLIRALLSLLRLPHDAVLDLLSPDSHEDMDVFNDFLTTLATSCRKGSRFSVDSLAVRGFPPDQPAQFVGFEFSSGHGALFKPNLIIVVRRPPNNASLAPFMSSFHTYLCDFAPLQAILVRGEPLSSTDEWVEMFSQLPKLGTVSIHGAPIDNFLRAITVRAPTPPAFPGLFCISFKSIKIVNSDSAVPASGTIACLADALNSRPSSHRISRMYIRNTAFSKGDLDILRAKVPGASVEERGGGGEGTRSKG